MEENDEDNDDEEQELDMDRVCDSCIYIGGVSATHSPSRLLIEHGITRLVSIGIAPSTMTRAHFQEDDTNLLLLDHVLDVEDQDLLATVLPKVLPFLYTAKNAHPPNPTLVHCAAGQSRSVAAVLAYLMVCEGFELVDAWRCVAWSRKGLTVNPGFLRQLNLLEDHRQGVPTASAEYRLYLLNHLLQQSTAIPSQNEVQSTVETNHQAFWSLMKAYGYLPVATHDKDGHDDGNGREEEEEWVGRCRHCQYPLFFASHQVRHCDELAYVERVRARISAIAEVSPETAAFAEYHRSFQLQPLLHLLPLPHQRGPKKKKGNEGARKEEERVPCPYFYVCPPVWLLPVLLASLKEEEGGRGGDSSGGGGLVCIRCPGRHCGASVGSMQALAGKATGAVEVCECGMNVPGVLVRFNRVDIVGGFL